MTMSFHNMECDLCGSTVAYQDKRPKGWVDIWIGPESPRFARYSIGSEGFRKDVPDFKASTLCPRCTSWIAKLLPIEILQNVYGEAFINKMQSK
jgi:hypothetical protein